MAKKLFFFIFFILVSISVYAQPFTGGFVDYTSNFSHGIYNDTRYFQDPLGASDITVQLALQSLASGINVTHRWNTILNPDGNQILNMAPYTSYWDGLEDIIFDGYEGIELDNGLKFTIEQDGVFDDILVVNGTNGKVGIRTASPGTTLDVNGSLTIGGGTIIMDDNTDNNILLANGTDFQSASAFSVTARPTAKYTVCASTYRETQACDYNCDGTADEVQINTAIKLAEPGGIVMLSDGTFTIAADIVMQDNVTLQGHGPRGTILQTTTNSINVIKVEGDSATNKMFGVMVRDLRIDGQGPPTSNGIYAKYANRNNFQNLEITGFDGHGIKVEGSNDNHWAFLYLDQCGSTSNTEAALYLGNVSDSNANSEFFTDVIIHTFRYYGIEVAADSGAYIAHFNKFVNIKLHGNEGTNNDDGIRIYGENNQFINLQIEELDDTAIYIDASGRENEINGLEVSDISLIADINGVHNVITNVTGNGGAGKEIDDGFSVDGNYNTITNVSLVALDGWAFQVNSDLNIISNVNLESIDEQGVILVGSDNDIINVSPLWAGVASGNAMQVNGDNNRIISGKYNGPSDKTIEFVSGADNNQVIGVRTVGAVSDAGANNSVMYQYNNEHRLDLPVLEVRASGVTAINSPLHVGDTLQVGSKTLYSAFYQDEGDIYSNDGKLYVGGGINTVAERYGVGLQVRERALTKTDLYDIDATFTVATQRIEKAGQTFVDDGVELEDFIVVTDADNKSYIGATGEIVGVSQEYLTISMGAAGGDTPIDLSNVDFVIYGHPIAIILDNGDIHFKVGVNPDASFKVHTEPSNNEHAVHFHTVAGVSGNAALEIEYDADTYSDTSAIEVDYDATAFDSADTVGTILDVIIDNAGATAGDIHALDVALTDASNVTVEVEAVATHTGVDVIGQYLGIPANMEAGWEADYNGGSPLYTDRTGAFGNSAINVAIFDDDNDFILLASSNKWDEIGVLLTTPASHTIIPTFHYIEDDGTWTVFTPADDTDGFSSNGTIRFDEGQLTNWGQRTVNEVTGEANGTDYYWIKITRTRNNLVTQPTESTITLIATGVKYHWDKNGEIHASTVTVEPVSNVACNADVEGKMFYDADDNTFKGCDGSSWQDFH